MKELFLYIIEAGEKKRVPLILQQNLNEESCDPAFPIFMADGEFGKVVYTEFETGLVSFQTIRLELNTEVTLSLALMGDTILFNYCLQGCFKFHTAGSRAYLLAESQGKIHYSGDPFTCSFTEGPAGNKEFLLFNMTVSLPLPTPEFSNGISAYLLERIKQMEAILPAAAAFNSSVDLQKNISETMKELRKNDPDKLQLNGFGILVLLAALDLSETRAFSKDVEKDPEERLIFLLAEGIILEMDEPWNIRKLASSKQLNQNKVKILFKKYMGMPAAAFKISVRMKKAQQMLLDTTLSVQEISLQVGYPNPAHFSSLFKRKMGCSPSSIRKAKESKNDPLQQG